MQIKLDKKQKEIQLFDNKDIYKIMEQILLREEKIDREKEHFWILGLDKLRRLLYVELVRLGPLSQKLSAHEAFKIAIDKKAVEIVLIQNRLKEDSFKLSELELDLTDHLIQIGNIIKINVADHLLIKDNDECFSLVDDGVFETLLNSRQYVPITTLERLARDDGVLEGIGEGFMEGEKVGIIKGKTKGKQEGLVEGLEKGIIKGLEQGKRDTQIEMIKTMMAKDIAIGMIVEITRLSKEEIEVLISQK